MTSFIPYGKQDISQDDIDAVVEVLQSDFITQGPKIPEFERGVAEYTGAKHGIAVNSVNCALYCGSDSEFLDIDRST